MNFSKLDATAQMFVKICSFLHFAQVQWDIFQRAFAGLDRGTSVNPQVSAFLLAFSADDGRWSQFKFQSMIANVRSYSMIYVKPGGSHSMHPLVHAWARDRMPAEECPTVRAAAIRLLSISVPEGQTQTDIEYRTALLDHCSSLQIPAQFLTVDEAEAFAIVYHQCAIYDRAEALAKHAWTLFQPTAGGNYCRLTQIGATLARVYMESGKTDDAQQLLSALNEAAANHLGVDHPVALNTHLLTGSCAFLAGRYSDARTILKSVIIRATVVLGETHYCTLEAMQVLGYTYRDLDRSKIGLAEVYRLLTRYEEAAQVQRLAIESVEQTLGSDHVRVLDATRTLAEIYRKQGRYVEAETMLMEIVQKLRKLLGGQHPLTGYGIHDLAFVLSDAGKLDEADIVFRDALLTMTQAKGPYHQFTLQIRSNLGKNLLRQGRLEEAHQVLKDVLAQQSLASQGEQGGIGFTEERLGCVCIELGHVDDGVALLSSATDRLGTKVGKGHPYTLEIMQLLADAYRRVGRMGEAEGIEREIISRRDQALQEKETVDNTDSESESERQEDERVVI
jgi:tetratricopeptide (TPR) repeat protein